LLELFQEVNFMIDNNYIIQNVEKQLNIFGVDTDSELEDEIRLLMPKVEMTIKNYCNISEIPDCLKFVFCDILCGHLLLFRKNSNRLNIENINFNLSEKSIQEGDTKVEFNSDGCLTNEQRFDRLIDFLLNYRKAELISQRCLKW